MNILHEKPSSFIVEILKYNKGYKHDGAIYTSEMNKRINTTYAHATKIANEMEEEGYIIRKKDGRKKRIELTPEGERIAKKVQELKGELQKV